MRERESAFGRSLPWEICFAHWTALTLAAVVEGKEIDLRTLCRMDRLELAAELGHKESWEICYVMG